MGNTVTMLTGTETHEVSVVDRAANRRRFAIAKQEKQDMPDNILGAVLATEAEGEKEFLDTLKAQDLSEKGLEAAAGLYRLLNGFRDELSGDAFQAVGKAAGLEVVKEPVKTEAPDQVIKSAELPEEVRKAFEQNQEELKAAREEAAEIRKALNDQQAETARKEFVQKAADNYSTLGEAQDLGLMLRDLHDVNKELADKVEQVFKAAEEKIQKGDLFAENGTDKTVSSDSVEAQVEQMAQELIAKSENKLSEAAARGMVWKSRPDLYKRYQEEQR